jgi:hypothetical protein
MPTLSSTHFPPQIPPFPTQPSTVYPTFPATPGSTPSSFSRTPRFPVSSHAHAQGNNQSGSNAGQEGASAGQGTHGNTGGTSHQDSSENEENSPSGFEPTTLVGALAIGLVSGFLSSEFSRAIGMNDQHRSFGTAATGGSPGLPTTGLQAATEVGARIGAHVSGRLHAGFNGFGHQIGVQAQLNRTLMANGAALRHFSSGAGLEHHELLPRQVDAPSDSHSRASAETPESEPEYR